MCIYIVRDGKAYLKALLVDLGSDIGAIGDAIQISIICLGACYF